VKTQVSATQAELQKTIADLKSVTGDLGVQSGLVATNGKELAASSASATATTSISSSARPSSRNVSAISRCFSRMPMSRRTGTRLR